MSLAEASTSDRLRTRSAWIQAASVSALAAFMTGAYLWLRHPSFEALQRALGVGATPLHDFAAFFYPMGKKLLADPTPVEGFLYTPFAALLFVPLGALPYAAAAYLWGAMLVLCVLGLARLSAQLVPPTTFAQRGLFFLLTGLAYPIWHNLKFGQVSIPLILGALLALLAYLEGRTRLSALLLAAVVAVKLYFGVLALLFVFRRDTRALAYLTLGCTMLLVVLPIVLFGPATALAFYGNVAAQLTERFGAGVRDINSQGVDAVLDRFGLAFVSRPVHGAAVVVCAFWAARLVRGARLDMVQGFVVLLAMTPFVAPTSWPHYFVYLPFCQAVVWAQLRTQPKDGRRHVGYLLSGLSALLITMPFFDLVADRALFVRAGLPFFANLSILIALFLARGTGAPPNADLRAF